MKGIKSYKNIYFLGIGGIGMSAIARFYSKLGVNVAGYDKTETVLTRQLENEGMKIHYSPDSRLIPSDTDMVIVTPAVPEDNPELIFFRRSGIPVLKRSEAVAEIVNDEFCIAVAGTHGKTTITSLITHIFKSAGLEVLAFVGGVMKNYNSNLVFSSVPDVCIVEADEFDQSFHRLRPDIAVVSAVDADHLDIYGNYNNVKNAFNKFITCTKQGGSVVLHDDIDLQTGNFRVSRYSSNSMNGLNARNINFINGEYSFDVYDGNTCLKSGILFPFAGIHNVENALAAVGVALSAGISMNKIAMALSCFGGIQRRFDIRFSSGQYVYIDDYAHHPREIDALIRGVRGMYPTAKVTGIFQPHLYSRTRDFAVEFAKSLEKLDVVILTDLYPAREKPIHGIDSEFLLRLIKHPEKYFCPKNKLLAFVEHLKPSLLLTIGAGDIDMFVPHFEELFKKMWEEQE